MEFIKRLEKLLLQFHMNLAVYLTDPEGNLKNSSGSSYFCHVGSSGIDHVTGQPVAVVQRKEAARTRALAAGRSWLLRPFHNTWAGPQNLGAELLSQVV